MGTQAACSTVVAKWAKNASVGIFRSSQRLWIQTPKSFGIEAMEIGLARLIRWMVKF